ncbi:HET-domain-containing protein [Mytilinidion resinicola]|uniref:HET-domain-containing protein n=1 Tax=Mytilinidion resinicola TaxID=574789 RepID=A0A6A6YQY8_9PEZI|nr:HET-domain-containing protein [Mytilinidion resinicola]KAF2811322.1 HET-domain-containing protein [Mytilinidion resinicola]
MRLIHARSIQLVDVIEESRPLYTILSHTGEENEVSFEDMQGPHATSKSGYGKIKYACQQALEDGLEYVWADTCCINKSSSTELSEAINSMFRWYKNAWDCYAYLADVHVHGSDVLSQDAIDAAFAQSRWFIRGWTLQELLAPSEVHFYSSDWGKLGTRYTLADSISAVTKIDRAFLLDRETIGQASIVKRMSWASGRVTTRLEDTAYCLLGIFDVNMPLLYGEGEKAFIRLQEEIMRHSDDQSLFAWGQEDEPHWMKANPTKYVRGLLASSPAEFSTCGNVIPDEFAELEEPHALTNKGVRLALPVLHHASQVHRTRSSG